MHYWRTLIVLLYVAGHYLVKLASCFRAWRRSPFLEHNSNPTPVSVIVPFRNEAQNLPTILQELANQKNVQAEFIFVDDHSTDFGGRLVLQWAARDGRFKLLQNDVHELGKKAAIAKGVAAASHRWIVTTDADTTRSNLWLQHIAGQISPDLHLLCAPVVIDAQNFFSKFQSLEMCVLNTITGASIQLGTPIMCSGANLAFDKDALSELEAHPADTSLLSGDDVFLMQRMHIAGKKIGYCISADAAVHTHAASWRYFWQQRVRWASKTSALQNRHATKFAQLVFVANMMVIWCLVGCLFFHGPLHLFVGYLALKTLADLLVLMPSAVRFGKTKDLFSLPWLVLAYPFYTIGVGLLSLWWRPKWKGRDLSLKSK
jgi:biofilm PGA synthesis N-glycosyltransferase PgaC